MRVGKYSLKCYEWRSRLCFESVFPSGQLLRGVVSWLFQSILTFVCEVLFSQGLCFLHHKLCYALAAYVNGRKG